MNSYSSKIAALILTSLSAVMLASCASLQTFRNVYVNGDKQNALGLAAFDVQTGMTVPDGRYWMNPVSGDWGVEGDTHVLGNIHSGMQRAQRSARTDEGQERGSISNSTNGTAGTGRDADGRHCAFVSIPGGDGMMTCD